MHHDSQLIAEYVDRRSELAFAELFDRHLSMVYSVCLRELNDRDSARDATQVTFMILARRARTIRHSPTAAAWLFATARNVARTQRRRDERRMRCEYAAAALADVPVTHRLDSPDIDQLNDLLARLRPSEIDLIDLRFFQGLSLAEVGQSVGISEDAARKRIARVLDRLRRGFVSAGVTTTLATVVAVLDKHAAQAAPIDLRQTVLTNVLAMHEAGGAIAEGVAQLYHGAIGGAKLATLKLVAGAAACLLFGAGCTLFVNQIRIERPATMSARQSAHLPRLEVRQAGPKVRLRRPAAGLGVSIPMETATSSLRRDPFAAARSPGRYRPPVPRIIDLVGRIPIYTTFNPYKQAIAIHRADVPIQYPAFGRVSGVIISGGAHAIYQMHEKVAILQPGDSLPDIGGQVTSIEPSGIVVRIDGRSVELPITSGGDAEEPATSRS